MMQAHTFAAIKAVLLADTTVAPQKRNQILRFMKTGIRDIVPKPSAPEKILRRKNVAERLGVSLRTVDSLAKEKVLKKVVLPGRKRACGFSSEEVDALIAGGRTNV